MIRYYTINGQRLPREEAMIGVEDLGLLRGYGIFDFFRFQQGKGVFMEDNLARFQRSAALLGMGVPYTADELDRQINELIAANGLPDGAIQMVLTGGYSPDNYTPARPNVMILQRKPPLYPPEAFIHGIKLLLHEYQREVPEVKTTNYLTGIRLVPQLQAAGAVEPLYHFQGWVRECVRSNVFIVNQAGVVVTPADQILHGITRMKVLELARQRYPVEERDVSLEELRTAREVFLTSTTKRVMPVTRIDDWTVGGGKPGEVSSQLAHDFARYEEAYLANLSPREKTLNKV